MMASDLHVHFILVELHIPEITCVTIAIDTTNQPIMLVQCNIGLLPYVLLMYCTYYILYMHIHAETSSNHMKLKTV